MLWWGAKRCAFSSWCNRFGLFGGLGAPRKRPHPQNTIENRCFTAWSSSQKLNTLFQKGVVGIGVEEDFHYLWKAKAVSCWNTMFIVLGAKHSQENIKWQQIIQNDCKSQVYTWFKHKVLSGPAMLPNIGGPDVDMNRVYSRHHLGEAFSWNSFSSLQKEANFYNSNHRVQSKNRTRYWHEKAKHGINY